MDWWRAGMQIISLMLGLVVASRQPAIVSIPKGPTFTLSPEQACFDEEASTLQTASIAGLTAVPTLRGPTPTIAFRPTRTPILITQIVVMDTPASSPSVTAPTITQPAIAKVEAETLNEAMNKYRTDQDLGSLAVNDKLCQVIEKRWQELANDFSHSGFEAAVSGLGYAQIAENIWSGTQSSTQQVIQSWQESNSHHKNMTGNWQFGCGTLKDGRAVYIFMSQ